MANLQIDVLGETFTINASEDEAYLKKILGYYRRIIEKIMDNGGLKDKLQTSILAGVMLCDELYKEKSKTAQMLGKKGIVNLENDDEVERIALEMIEKIDRAIGGQ